MAPKMADNFIKLCKGLPDGRGYKGSKIFRAKANDHVLGGDFENDDGTGGHSAYEEKYFLAEQCPLKVTLRDFPPQLFERFFVFRTIKEL